MPMLAALLLLQATSPTAPAATPVKNAKTDPNRMVCVTEQVTGSRLGSQKRCLTAAQWEQHHRDEQMAVDRYQRLGRPGEGG